MSNYKENGSRAYLYGICAVAVIGGLLFGYDTAVISGAEQALQFFFVSGLGDYYTTSIHGFVVSSALIGCIIGGLISGVMATKLGRRNSLILASVFFFLSALGSFMPEFLFRPGFEFFQPGEATKGLMWAFILYRVLGGVGVGMASAICPMYIAEVSPAHLRGRLVSFNQFAIIFGQLTVYFINFLIRSGLADTPELIQAAMVDIGWRRMFVSEAFPAAAFGLLLLLVPKTPRYLVMAGNTNKALDVLTRINGEKRAREILSEIKETMIEKREKLFSYGVLV
ncbi:MAG: MFS transporter, partial [Bacteroidales bacterium]|nr:MFS transporter [Bacteroidales bacterium]